MIAVRKLIITAKSISCEHFAKSTMKLFVTHLLSKKVFPRSMDVYQVNGNAWAFKKCLEVPKVCLSALLGIYLAL